MATLLKFIGVFLIILKMTSVSAHTCKPLTTLIKSSEVTSVLDNYSRSESMCSGPSMIKELEIEAETLFPSGSYKPMQVGKLTLKDHPQKINTLTKMLDGDLTRIVTV